MEAKWKWLPFSPYMPVRHINMNMKRIRKILIGGIMMIPAPVFSQNMMMTMGQNTTVPIEQTTHYKRYHGFGALVRCQCGCYLFAQEVDTQDETRWD